MPSTRALATEIGVSLATIRNWSARYEHFLAKEANPNKNYSRAYSKEDAEVLVLVAEMRSQGRAWSVRWSKDSDYKL